MEYSYYGAYDTSNYGADYNTGQNFDADQDCRDAKSNYVSAINDFGETTGNFVDDFSQDTNSNTVGDVIESGIKVYGAYEQVDLYCPDTTN